MPAFQAIATASLRKRAAAVEKRAWIMLVVSTVACAAYVIIIVSRAAWHPPATVSYASTLLWMIGAAVVGSIVAEIVGAIANLGASRAKDVRDREIGRLREYTGQVFVIIGAVAAMLMAMAGWPGSGWPT